jgi:hypothetical protein
MSLVEVILAIAATVEGGILATFGVNLGHFVVRLRDAEGRIDVLTERLEGKAKIIRAMGDYIDALRHHIAEGLPPPPPPRPEGL